MRWWLLAVLAALTAAQEEEWPRGENPEPLVIADEMARLSAVYEVPVELICAVAHRESGIQQWRADGSFVYNKSDFGLGMMQLTGATADAYDKERLKTDWRYNLEAGVKVLVGKWQRAVTREHFPAGIEVDRGLLENWYYALCYYNGKTSDVYVAKIYEHAASLPGRMAQILEKPVEITRPESVLEGFEWGDAFVAVAEGLIDSQGTLHPATVHRGALGDPELYAFLDRRLQQADRQLERDKPIKALAIYEELLEIPELSPGSLRMLAGRVEALEEQGRAALLAALEAGSRAKRRAALSKLRRNYKGLAVGLAVSLAWANEEPPADFLNATLHEARGEPEAAIELYRQLAEEAEDEPAAWAAQRLEWLEAATSEP